MSVFDEMTKEEIQAAQVLLNKLCKENDIHPFSIIAKKAPWKKLVLSMCGINEDKAAKRRGPKPRQQEQIDDFLNFIMTFAEFGDSSGKYPKLTMQDLYKEYIKKHQPEGFDKPFRNIKILENVFYAEYKNFMQRLNKRFEDMKQSDEELL